MIPQLWLLTILAPLALGVPVPRESVTPSVTFSDSTSDIETSDGPKKMGLNHANKLSYQLKSDKSNVGSKTTLDGQGSPSLGGYSAHGTGVSYSSGQVSGINSLSSLNAGTSGGTSGENSGGTTGGTSGGTPDGSFGGTSGATSGGISDGTSDGNSPDGGASKELKEGGSHGGHGSGMEGGKTHEQVEYHDSGSTTGSEGTTTASESTTSGITTGTEGTTGSDGTTTSTSKHK